MTLSDYHTTYDYELSWVNWNQHKSTRILPHVSIKADREFLILFNSGFSKNFSGFFFDISWKRQKNDSGNRFNEHAIDLCVSHRTLTLTMKFGKSFVCFFFFGSATNRFNSKYFEDLLHLQTTNICVCAVNAINTSSISRTQVKIESFGQLCTNGHMEIFDFDYFFVSHILILFGQCWICDYFREISRFERKREREAERTRERERESEREREVGRHCSMYVHYRHLNV